MTTAPDVAVGPVFCALVADTGMLTVHHRIRHEVFVYEQAIFPSSDSDHWDTHADVLHVLAWCGRTPAGTVRLYPLDDSTGLWQGDRLAVLPEFRTAGVGGPLVYFAVATAGALGGRRMVAHVQLANQRFFEHLGWERAGAVEDYVGRPHVSMTIGL